MKNDTDGSAMDACAEEMGGAGLEDVSEIPPVSTDATLTAPKTVRDCHKEVRCAP